MSIDVNTLIQPITEDQALEVELSILETLGVKARSWRVGGAYRTILRVTARMFSGLTSTVAAAIQSNWLEKAAGPWLVRVAKYGYGVDAITATFATGKLRFTNSGGGVYSYNAREVRALWVSEKKAYTNTAPFALNPGDSILVDIEAVEIGAASSAPPGAIDSLETALLGVTVTNPEAVVGNDSEADETLRQRCLDKLGALSLAGPRGAYAYAVTAAKRNDGTPVNINRLSVTPDSSTGVVTIYVASPAGAPDAGDITLVEASIEAIARPDSVTVNVYAATEVPLTATITVWAKRTAGVSASDLEDLVSQALIAAIKTYPIGGFAKPPEQTQGYLYGDFIARTAMGAHESIYDVDGADTDQAINPGQVATLATTITVRVVDTP